MAKSLRQSPRDHSVVNDREALLPLTLLMQGDGELTWAQAPTEIPSFPSQTMLQMLTCNKQKGV